VVVPESKPSGLQRSKTGERLAPANSSGRSIDLPWNLENDELIASLKDLISAGNHQLDTLLATLADAARQMTGATGAALAMWKDGAMLCRARSGETAPPLGARLSANTGISGECLRTGKSQNCSDTENDPVVDMEVCRSLGLRSIAVLPIRGGRGISGILEVFSGRPGAFSGAHMALLQQLAALAERARVTQPQHASPSVPKVASATSAKSAGLLPASDRVGDVALAVVDRRSRPLVLGAICIAAAALIALAVWLGWRGTDEVEGKSRNLPAGEGAGKVAAVRMTESFSGSRDKRATDRDAIWKENPGGEMLFSSAGKPSGGRTSAGNASGKPSAGAPVQFASKIEVIAGRKANAGLLSDLASSVAGNPAITKGDFQPRNGAAPGTGAIEPVAVGSANDQYSRAQHNDPGDASSSGAEPPTVSSGSGSSSALGPILTAKASIPARPVIPPPISQGVTGGQLIHRVPPVYPAQAITQKLQGTVILAAMVMEDGSLRDVKVVDGPQLLALSAVDAVKQWRFKPYALDGKPVKNEVRISVDFKIP
jgi:TonB family protein